MLLLGRLEDLEEEVQRDESAVMRKVLKSLNTTLRDVRKVLVSELEKDT